MALPFLYPFKTRMYQVTSTTSNVQNTVGIAARCKYVSASYATMSSQSHTAVGAITVKTGTAAGVTIISSIAGLITTSTGDSATLITPDSTTTIFLAAGDTLVTAVSSVVGGTVTHVVQEF
jgi:hypothetical protein